MKDGPACKDLLGRIVVLTRTLRTRGGAVHPAGDRYRVSTTWRGRFSLIGVTATGRDRVKRNGAVAAWISGVHRSSFEEVCLS